MIDTLAFGKIFWWGYGEAKNVFKVTISNLAMGIGLVSFLERKMFHKHSLCYLTPRERKKKKNIDMIIFMI